MTIGNAIRSLMSTQLLLWAARIAPPEERTLLLLIVHEYLTHMVRKDAADLDKEPPPPDWTVRKS